MEIIKNKMHWWIVSLSLMLISISIFCCIFLYKYRSLVLLSEVKAPVRMALKNIMEDMETGNNDIARQKLKLLQKRWENFYLNNDSSGLGNIMVDIYATERIQKQDSSP